MSARIEAWATVYGGTITGLHEEWRDADVESCGEGVEVVHLIPATDLARSLDVLRELTTVWAEDDYDSGLEWHGRWVAALDAARALLAEVDR